MAEWLLADRIMVGSPATPLQPCRLQMPFLRRHADATAPLRRCHDVTQPCCLPPTLPMSPRQYVDDTPRRFATDDAPAAMLRCRVTRYRQRCLPLVKAENGWHGITVNTSQRRMSQSQRRIRQVVVVDHTLRCHALLILICCRYALRYALDSAYSLIRYITLITYHTDGIRQRASRARRYVIMPR